MADLPRDINEENQKGSGNVTTHKISAAQENAPNPTHAYADKSKHGQDSVLKVTGILIKTPHQNMSRARNNVTEEPSHPVRLPSTFETLQSNPDLTTSTPEGLMSESVTK